MKKDKSNSTIPEPEILKLGLRADKYIDSNDIIRIKTYIDTINKHISKTNYSVDKAYLYYILGNLYLAANNNTTLNINDNTCQAINALRKAKETCPNIFNIGQINQNIANILSHQFLRKFESLELRYINYSDKSDIPYVSAYHKTFELLWLANFVYPENSQYEFRVAAYFTIEELLLHINECSHPKIKTILNSVITHLQTEPGKIKNKDVEQIVELIQWGRSNGGAVKLDVGIPPKNKKLKAYQQWCMNNGLILDFLNIINQESWIASLDWLAFPSHLVDINKGPVFPSAFSIIKREYCFARHLLYEGLYSIHPKYEDKMMHGKLTTTFENDNFDGALEKVKLAYRSSFSLLDKIAVLINQYYGKPTQKEQDVAFTSRWFHKTILEKHPNNPFLIALAWLSCDLSKNTELKYQIEPDLADIKKIRKKLEHYGVKTCDTESRYIWEEDDFTCKISEQRLKELTIKTFKLTRNAFFYFCLAVQYDEMHKDAEGKHISSMDVPKYLGHY